MVYKLDYEEPIEGGGLKRTRNFPIRGADDDEARHGAKVHLLQLPNAKFIMLVSPGGRHIGLNF